MPEAFGLQPRVRHDAHGERRRSGDEAPRAIGGGARVECDRLNYPLLLTLGLAALALVLFELGGHRTFGKHEGLAVLPAREMLATGDWVVPRLAGVPRLEKPPLIYWILATLGQATGEINEFIARLPAAVSSLLTAALVGFWAGRWYDRTTGVGASVAFVGSLFTLTYARRAEVDMALCLLTTSALFLVATQPATESSGKRFFRFTAFYGLLSLSWLAKFHYGPVMVMGPALFYATLQRRWRTLRALLNPPGLAMLAYAVWGWTSAVARRIPQAMEIWQTQTVGRVVGDLGAEPIWFYVEYVFALILPWTPVALIAVLPSWKRAWSAGRTTENESADSMPRRALSQRWKDFAARGDERERFLWIWFLAQLLILTLSAGKHSHYLAASIPMLAILSGQGIRIVCRHLNRGQFQWDRGMATICSWLIVLVSAAISAALSWRWPDLMFEATCLGALLAVGGLLAAWLIYAGDYVPACHVVAVAFAGGFMLTSWKFVPAEDFRQPAAQFSREMRTQVGEDIVLWTYGLGTDPLHCYLGRPTRRLTNREALESALKERDAITLVTHAELLPELKSLGSVAPIGELDSERWPDQRRLPSLVCLRLARKSPERSGPLLDVRHVRNPAADDSGAAHRD